MNRRRIIFTAFLAGLLFVCQTLHAQNPLSRFRGMGNMGGGKSGAGDTLVHRKADTITINYRYLDSSRLLKMDSTVGEFSRKVPNPPTWINLGNMGTPARNLAFDPRMRSGWDLGLHAYDLYTFKVDETKFYHTTKPYTELGWLLGARSEQLINIVHTQNIRPNWNFLLEYRLMNGLGSFQNQNINHNNYRISSWYQSKNKRYQNFFILVSNKMAASDNGGLRSPKYFDSVAYASQAVIPVWLGNNLSSGGFANIFAPVITTGTRYKTSTYLMRQQYDLGQKDSTIVNDTTVIPLFYPRLRLEHTLSYSTYSYQYADQSNPTQSYYLDSAYYSKNYGWAFLPNPDSARLDTIIRRDRWNDFSNDFSIYTFPDAKNPQQFLKLGASLQLLKGYFDTASLAAGSQVATHHSFTGQNVFAHAEYRNKTRNQKWDIEAFGKLYLNGLNSGDYDAYISLKRLISRQVGYLQVGFQNTNQTPGYVFDRASSFHIDTANTSFNKENITNIFASLEQPKYHLRLQGAYYLLSNYVYYRDYSKASQESSLFNVLVINAQKMLTIYRHWKWHTNLTVQHAVGSTAVNLPTIVFHNRIGYEGELGFKNLQTNFGAEVRYISGYKADGYAPLTGQFFTQSDTTIKQRLPDINLFVHFRIRSFTAYVRAENINTMKFSPRGFGWYGNNYVAKDYASPGMLIRFGFFWGFVN